MSDNLIAEAKEDLGSTEAELLENKKYLANLNKMCAEGDAAFEKRKASRLEEIKQRQRRLKSSLLTRLAMSCQQHATSSRCVKAASILAVKLQLWSAQPVPEITTK